MSPPDKVKQILYEAGRLDANDFAFMKYMDSLRKKAADLDMKRIREYNEENKRRHKLGVPMRKPQWGSSTIVK